MLRVGGEENEDWKDVMSGGIRGRTVNERKVEEQKGEGEEEGEKELQHLVCVGRDSCWAKRVGSLRRRMEVRRGEVEQAEAVVVVKREREEVDRDGITGAIH